MVYLINVIPLIKMTDIVLTFISTIVFLLLSLIIIGIIITIDYYCVLVFLYSFKWLYIIL